VSEIAGEVLRAPHGGLLLVACLAAILVQVGVLAVQGLRRSADTAALSLNVAGALSILVMLVVGGWSTSAARALMTAGFHDESASQKATDLSDSISGQLNALPLMATVAMLALILWLIGVNRALERRPSGGARRAFAALALFGGAALAAGVGVVRWSARLIATFAGLAGVDPSEKGPILGRALDEGHATFRSDARVAYVALGLATLVAIVLAARGGSGTPAPAAPRRSSTVAPLLVTGGALGLAAVLFVLTGPMRRENALPWPTPSSGDDVLLVLDVLTPEVRGPDPLERAPVVEVFNDKTLLDGAPCDLESLGDKLRTLRSYYRMLHPTGRFNGSAVLLVDYSLPIDRFVALAHTIHDAGYDRPLLTFTKVETLWRPVFGKVRRVVATGARLKLLDHADIEAAGADLAGQGTLGTLLVPDDLDIYDDLAKKVVALRNAGGAVALNLGKPPAR
jgi:hypothetical protein